MNKEKSTNVVIFVVLCLMALAALVPILLVLMNSFKPSVYISADPFGLPIGDRFAGVSNFVRGLSESGLLFAFLRSLFITVAGVLVIVLCSSMCAWYLVRVPGRMTRGMYYLLLFSMIVPFQMVMYTLTYVAGKLSLNSLPGILPIYLGFGAGLSVFMLSGFIKSVPKEIEEAASIDGASPLGTFFLVVLPILKPTATTVAVLNAMWLWNDYLLPYLILGTDNKTIPVAIQIAMQGAYGATDYGGLMAMLVLCIIPIVLFYLLMQKYIIRGVVAGAVKG